MAASGGQPSKEEVRELKKAARAENKDYMSQLSFLSKVPLFNRLPKDQQPILLANLEKVEIAAGTTIMKEGDPGHEFYVIQEGTADVFKKAGGEDQRAATLQAGDFFGEHSLRFEEPRMATVKAATKIVAFKMTREQFHTLGLNDKLQFANRKAVGNGGDFGPRQIKTKPPSAKSAEEAALITNALKKNENLEAMVQLEASHSKALVEVAWKETVKKGTELISEGDLNADYFYIVQDGCFEVSIFESEEGDEDETPKAREAQSSKFVSKIGAGGSFGELALLYLVPRSSTVLAQVDSTVWVIDRMNFKSILMRSSEAKITEYQGYIEKVAVLEPLLKEEKKAIAEALVEMHFDKGEMILQQGEPGSTFYILYEGEVRVEMNGAQVKTLSVASGDVQYFGERALMENEPRTATVTVASDRAKALALDRDSFDYLLGPLKDLLESAKKLGAGRKSMVQRKSRAAPVFAKMEKIRREDLQRIGLLGCGGFGAVELKENVKTGATYAMKALSKGYIVKTGMQESVMNEKNILMLTNSPFIVKLYATYNGTQTLYFLLEAALGGELYATYNRKGFHGSEPHAMYYTAGVVFAFSHLHERRIIYRDLKPENLLLTEDGHIKLTDMGLAKFVIGKTYTTCGTPDYFAPELIASAGHTHAVDWWTLGILVYELMSGHPPFESKQPMQTYAKVSKGIGAVQFSSKVKGQAEDFVRCLLRRDPSQRLPMRSGGVKGMKEHGWFTGNKFDWQEMFELKRKVPYAPVVKNKKDMANFHARKEDMPKVIEYKDDGSGWDLDFES